MTEDLRCCGSGTCIIDNEGRCWCGQQWDGQKMVHPSRPQAEGTGLTDVADAYALPDRPDDAFDDPPVHHRVVRRADGGDCDGNVRR
jgi:hypothetical protein